MDQHVGAYLKYKSRKCRVATLRSIATGIAMVFDEMKDTLGLEENPVMTGLVHSYLDKLQRRRRERAAQMDPIREEQYQAVIASVMKTLVGEKSGRAESRAALVVALFSVMFDGMLQAGEAEEARWGDVSRLGDGSGRLYVPFSKTDQFSVGEYVYLSSITTTHLGWDARHWPIPFVDVHRATVAAALAPRSFPEAEHQPVVVILEIWPGTPILHKPLFS